MGKLNPYTARVDRMHPMAFVFLIDQSGSMSSEVNFGTESSSKHIFVANAINKIIEEVISKCTKTDEIRHYFDITIIGYGENSSNANYLYEGENDSPWVSPEYLNNTAKTREVEKQVKTRSGVVTQMAVEQYWLEPMAKYRTPMYDAFRKTKALLKQWCDSHSGEDCFPPIVINISDGFPTDAKAPQMIDIANEIKALGTMDGNVLIFNIHLSSNNEHSQVVFPKDIAELDGSIAAEMLYEMSSELPSSYNKEIAGLKGEMSATSYRAMGFNTRADFVQMLNVGTMTNLAEDDE